MTYILVEILGNTHDEGMEVTPLPVACKIAQRPFFRRVYIFVEERSQRVCLLRVLYDEFRYKRRVRRCMENRRRTFGIGRNIVGTTNEGTYKSGTSSSSSSLSSDGGGGTSL